METRPISELAEKPAKAAHREKKDYPLSMRLPEADIAMIDRAAKLHRRTRTDFVRDAAVRAAEAALLEHRVITMSPEGFTNFLAIIDAPPVVVPEMLEVIQRKAPWEKSGAED